VEIIRKDLFLPTHLVHPISKLPVKGSKKIRKSRFFRWPTLQTNGGDPFKQGGGLRPNRSVERAFHQSWIGRRYKKDLKQSLRLQVLFLFIITAISLINGPHFDVAVADSFAFD
jgi:hypothetical protein